MFSASTLHDILQKSIDNTINNENSSNITYKFSKESSKSSYTTSIFLKYK